MNQEWLELLSENDLFVEKTIAQIEKDVHSFVEVMPFKIQNRGAIYLETINWIEQLLQGIIENNPAQLLQFLYAVDLSEKQLKIILANPQPESLSKIAVLVLEREAKKVFFRMKYSGS